MRKLKLQVQMTVDGFVAGPKGELDWMTWVWDKELENYVNELHVSVDTILLGRKMTEGFISYWTDVVKNKPDSREYNIAKKMVYTPKIVFTKTLDKSDWENTRLAKGNIVEEVNQLKKQDGEDIIVYGGGGFVTNLIKHDLIDEYHLFKNPVAIGNGMTIFNESEKTFKLKLVEAKSFESGIVMLKYIPERA